MTKPTLVGGLPVKTLDFIPSILFACLYAVTLLFMGYNVCFKKGSRTWVLVGTLSFVIERCVSLDALYYSIKLKRAAVSSYLVYEP